MLNFRKHFRAPKIQAFSLIEMSLVLAIMGTLASLSLPMLLDYKSTQKRQHTTKHIDLVLSATGTFAAAHRVLPCPASKTSRGEPVVCTTETLNLATGYVPYKTLGLSEASSKDGFGNPLRYAINPRLSSHETFYDNTHISPLKVVDNEERSVFDLQNDKDKLAVVVLSEGEAFRTPQSSFERRNTDERLTFVEAPYSVNKENPFRHIVRWSTRNNLLTYYGKSAPLSQPQNALENNQDDRRLPRIVPHDRIVPPPRNPLQNPLGGDFESIF